MRTVSPSRGSELETYLGDPSWWTVLSQAGKAPPPEIIQAVTAKACVTVLARRALKNRASA
jgi:hypothetical protein